MDRWVEENWDHKTLIWEEDPWFGTLHSLDPDGVLAVPFNPTSENIALYLLKFINRLLKYFNHFKIINIIFKIII